MTNVIQYNNATLTYSMYGDGEALVLLHGFAETGAIWKNQVAVLSERYRLIVPDLPGSGASAALMGDDALSIADLADSIYAIIESEKIERCIMLGHSMGGYITLNFAGRYANRCKGFGLINSTAFADSPEKRENRLRGIEIMGQYGAYAFIKNTTPNLFSGDFKAAHSGKIEALVEAGRNFATANLQQYYRAMISRNDATAVLRETTVPVLFVIGTDDVAAPLNDVLKQVTLPGIAYIHILKNSGHMSMLECPGELNSILTNFANDVA